MIHNNFRKLMRSFSKPSQSVSASPVIVDFTNINGYTGNTADDKIRNIYKDSYALPPSITAGSYSTIKGKTNAFFFYAMAGHTIENEPDYTLGTYFDDIQVSPSVSKDYNYTITTALTNNTNASMVIDEIGLFFHLYDNSYPFGSSLKNEFLLFYEIFDEPITLGAGQGISVTFNLFGDVTISEA